MSDDMPLDPIDDSWIKPGAQPPSAARRATRPAAATLSALAVISLILGGISPLLICVCYSSLATSLAAIITGHIAQYQIRRSAGALKGTGLSIAGLVLGYVSFTLTAAIFGFFIMLGHSAPDDDADVAEAPGKAELMEAEQKIVSDRNGYALGNTAEARDLARRFADELKAFDETLFTQTDATLKLSGGQYVTWCELRDGQCAFIVHVPEYRKFEADAKDALADLAWLTAQGAVADTLQPGDELAVGLKGLLLYGDVMVGRVEYPEEESGEGIVQNDADKSSLYPLFIPEDPLRLRPRKKQSAGPVEEEPPSLPAVEGEVDSATVAPAATPTPKPEER